MKWQLNIHQKLLNMFGSRSARFYLLSTFMVMFASLVWTGAGAQTQHPSKAGERICLSIRALSVEAKKAQLSTEIESFAGIGWLEGFVVDQKNQDVILFGQRLPKRPTLHLDDLAVSLRNIWNREAYPYCSLDPRPEDVRKLNLLVANAGGASSVAQMHSFFNQLKGAMGPQTVVVGGVPRNSRHAHVMIDADYHMKKLSQGLVHLQGISSCLDLVLDDVRRQINNTGRVPPQGMSMSRFWFHVRKGDPTYQEGDGIVCLEKCAVVVLTEKQRSTVDGILYDSAEGDPHANAFAQGLSDCFQTAATMVPEYANLENLFRLSAILRAMLFRNATNQAGLDLGFWLRDYKYKEESAMPPSLSGLANSKEATFSAYVLFPMTCGGVSMDIKLDERRFAKTKVEQMNKLRALVIKSRPSLDALSWQLPSNS